MPPMPPIRTLSQSPLFTALTRFAGLVLLFSLSRLLFFLFNMGSFPHPTWAVWCHGIRYDVIIILIINVFYFIPNLLPFRFITHRTYCKIENIGLFVFNCLALALNLIDTCYYPFSMRRMTGDIFHFIHETNNFGTLIPVFLKDYFYMIFILAVLIFLLILLIFITEKSDSRNFIQKGKQLWLQIGVRLILLFLMMTGMRGGWQYRPLNVAAAANVAGIENAALVLNTPFSLLTTLNQKGVERKHYFSDETSRLYFSTTKNDFDTDEYTFPKTKNVVLIILEGISSEYSDFLADEPKKMAGFTPFLDSLAKKSLVFKGYANGQQSIEALSSILGGIPSLMETPFSQSQYAANRIDYALPKLKQRGMHTLFFHGGKNGTMGFDRYCQLAGIDDYYGLNEYTGPESDFDGTWGISDIPYLQYFAESLNHETRPFFATVFTLSSHHPFVVPKEVDAELPTGSIPMQHTVAYTDLALRKFFSKVSQSEWYDETLFVITADHTNFKDAKGIDYPKHRYAVPIIFFHPRCTTPCQSETVMQQADIMPSIFAFCGWKDSFQSFGNNVFSEAQPHFALNYLSGMYQLYTDHYLIEFDGNTIRYIWDLHQKGKRQPLPAKETARFRETEKLLKSVIQQFNNGLLDNQL